MWTVKFLAVVAVAYLMVVGLVFAAQTSLLFPTRMVGASPPLAPGSERLLVAGSGGTQLHGVHIPPAQREFGRPVILGFGGNSWNAASVAGYLHELYPQADVVAFHYRGYAPSGGKPSAAALLSDAPLIHDHVANVLGADRIVGVGFSIGSGVAAHLASQRHLAGVILVTPFDSLRNVAGSRYRWLPVSLLLRHHIEPVEDLRAVTAPVAIIAAERDTIVPSSHARTLARAIPNLAYERVIPHTGHNDIYQNPGFRSAMVEALAVIEEVRPE